MAYTFEKTEWAALTPMIAAYHEYLGWRNDQFHNRMLYHSGAYRIVSGGAAVGFAGICDGWNGGRMLCGLFLRSEARRDAAGILSHLIADFDLRDMLIPSNDALLVAAGFEQMHLRGTSFEMQAYQYTYGLPARPAEYSRAQLFELMPEEYPEAERLTGDQWEGVFGDPDFRFYAIREGGKTLGYGCIGRMIYNPRCLDVGNFTLPEYRRQGVGRSMLIHLGAIAKEEGYLPVTGCWYGNKESIPTIRSSGFVPENRIFLVHL